MKDWKAEHMRRAGIFILVLNVALSCARAADEPVSQTNLSAPEALIPALKELEGTLGFPRTKNFLTHSAKAPAIYRCYYTEKLELPESYEGLHLKQGTQFGCDVDPAKYDVFFYAIEAVASGKTPVTASLARDSIERFLVVVSHEDFHENRQLSSLPATLTEPASTLIGILTASALAREKFGADSGIAQNLAREPELFLHKAEIVNRYYAGLSRVYGEARLGEISVREALERKQGLFEAMLNECRAISPDPRSFNKCPSADNNAALAFDRTYTKYYPLMYNLYVARGHNLRATIDSLNYVLAATSESDAIERLRVPRD